MLNIEAGLLCSQLLGSFDIGTERGAAQLSWTGGEVSSTEKIKQCIFILACLYFIVLFSSPPFFFFFMDTDDNYNTIDLLYITSVPYEI